MYSTQFDMVNINGIAYRPELVYKTILGVFREGKCYTKVSTTPTGREFRFTPSTGKVAFKNLGSLGVGFIQKVIILYR